MRDQIAALSMIVLAAFGGIYAMLSGGDNARPSATAPLSEAKPRDESMARFLRAPIPRLAPDGVLLDAADAPVKLSDFRGKVVLINLWASWCTPCLAEMPALDRLQKAMGGPDFEVVTVNIESKPELGKAWLAEHGIANLPFRRDDGLNLYSALGGPNLPFSLLIDRQGREIGRLSGDAVWDGGEARALIAAAIAEKAAPHPEAPGAPAAN